MWAYMRTLLKMMSDYSSVHDRNASLKGNEYPIIFVYSVINYLLVLDLPHHASQVSC